MQFRRAAVGEFAAGEGVGRCYGGVGEKVRKDVGALWIVSFMVYGAVS